MFASLLAHRGRAPLGEPCHYLDYEGRPLCGVTSDHRPGEEHEEHDCAAAGHVRCATCASLLDVADRMEALVVAPPYCECGAHVITSPCYARQWREAA